MQRHWNPKRVTRDLRKSWITEIGKENNEYMQEYNNQRIDKGDISFPLKNGFSMIIERNYRALRSM